MEFDDLTFLCYILHQRVKKTNTVQIQINCDRLYYILTGIPHVTRVDSKSVSLTLHFCVLPGRCDLNHFKL